MFSFIKSAVSAVTTGVAAATAQPVQIGDRWVVVKEQLGEGGFAFVNRAEDPSTGQSFALKRMLCQDGEARSVAETEIRVLRALRGKSHILQYVASCKRENTETSHRATEYLILLELCAGGSLIDLIQRRAGRKLGEPQVADLFTQICRGVAHMHAQSPPIAHRDLKIENVLLNDKGLATLCDFGSSTTRAQAYTTTKEIVEEEERRDKYSTQMYRSPELTDLYKRVLVNEKVDIWALGCILFTLAFFTQPFQDGGNLQIISGTYAVPESHSFSKYLTALIKRLLTVDPLKRPDITQTLNLCEQWNAFLKNGGSAKTLKPSAASSASASTAPSAPSSARAPATAITDPSHRSRRAEEAPVGEEPRSAKPAKAKKLKRAPKLPQQQEADDWADFSSAPATAAKAPAPASSSSDDSTDDEAPAARRAPPPRTLGARSNSQPISSAAVASLSKPPSQHRPPQQTASLFDLSSFGDFATPSPSPAAAAVHNVPEDDWAAFDSAATMPSNSFGQRQQSASVSVSASSSNFDFDFSGLHAAAPSPTPKSPLSTSSNTSSGSSRKQRHSVVRAPSDTIDLSRLSISRSKNSPAAASDSSSDDDQPAAKPQRIGKIAIGKPR